MTVGSQNKINFVVYVKLRLHLLQIKDNEIRYENGQLIAHLGTRPFLFNLHLGLQENI